MRWTTLGAPSIAWTRAVPRSRRPVDPVEPGDAIPAPSSVERDPRPVPPTVARNDASPLRPRHVDRI
jgi:hypothetical protein